MNVTKGFQFIFALALAGAVQAASMFERDDTQDANGTYLVAEVDVAPLFMVQRFGPPGEGDGDRVSGQYIFKSATGVVFTVHDYKSTTLWVTDEGLPTPTSFWKAAKPQELSIGSRGNDPKEFRKWLLDQYQAWKANK